LNIIFTRSGDLSPAYFWLRAGYNSVKAKLLSLHTTTMSTFNGFVKEFPDIRIDFFRMHPDKIKPSICLLSHIHSDHLQGLETHKMPFVYCSAATKRILLRMEKYPHRINYAKGILEARKQTYRHLQKVLRALPMQTPVDFEPRPNLKLRVTLFDANHCPGAVMFLVEGSGKAILYTGDVRSEPWWVNSIVRNPYLIPYAAGQRRFDCIYLDTTFASHDDMYKDFQTKAEGLRELLSKVSQCPPDSIFYFRAWTLGYEDVWLALSTTLDSKVHVDQYQLRLFRSLVEGTENYHTAEAGALVGCAIGNATQEGCLTTDEGARIHSCEPGTACHDRLTKNKKVIWLTPIISRLQDGTELAEIGAGGGGGDLYQIPELEMNDMVALNALQTLCADIIKDKDTLDRILSTFARAQDTGSSKLSLQGLGLDLDAEISLKDFVKLVSRKEKWASDLAGLMDVDKNAILKDTNLTDTIHFPFSRHSSYSELRNLLSALRPRDVCACTVELDSWSENVSMKSLFGDLCSGKTFYHDEEVRQKAKDYATQQGENNNKKRKWAEEENIDSQQSVDMDEIFQSARTSIKASECSERTSSARNAQPTTTLDMPKEDAENGELMRTPQALSTLAVSERRDMRETQRVVGQRQDAPLEFLEPNHDLTLLEDSPSESGSDFGQQLEAIKRAYYAIKGGNTTAISKTDVDRGEEADEGGGGDDGGSSQITLSTVAFESQLQDPQTGGKEEEEAQDSDDDKGRQSDRVRARKEAYRAARVSLDMRDSSEWNDISLRSAGRGGHSEDETEL